MRRGGESCGCLAWRRDPGDLNNVYKTPYWVKAYKEDGVE